MKHFFRTFLYFGLVAVTLAGCADMRTAKLAIEHGDYKTAHEHLEKLAVFGLPEAQTELAVLLLKEDTGISDTTAAKKWLEYAAGQNNPRAYMELGKLYEKGTGVKADTAKAASLYHQALNLGYERAAYQLGRMEEKRGHYQKAEQLYKKAVDGGYSTAAAKTADLYLKGKGRPADPNKALAWYYIAQEKGAPGLEAVIAKQEAVLGPERVAEAQTLSKGLY